MLERPQPCSSPSSLLRGKTKDSSVQLDQRNSLLALALGGSIETPRTLT